MSTAADDRSLGQLVASATTELSALVHDEIALAKAEIRRDVKRGAIGSGAAIVAGVLVLFSLPMFSFAAAYGIRRFFELPLAACFAIVGGAFVVLALLLLLIGRAMLKKIEPPKRTIASAKESAAVLQNAKPHPRPAAGRTPARSSSAVSMEKTSV